MKQLKRICSFALIITLLASTVSASAAATYSDIPEGAWYASAVEHVTNRGIFNGYSTEVFAPQATLTREMFVTALGRKNGLDLESIENNHQFSDVDFESWSGPYIVWAYETGLTQGTSATTFSPKDAVTREQVAVFVDNYLCSIGLPADAGEESSCDYSDADGINLWAVEAVESLYDCGLMTGNPQGEFEPKESITRAEAAVVLTRLDEYVDTHDIGIQDNMADTPQAAEPSFSIEISGYRNPQSLIFQNPNSGGGSPVLCVKVPDGVGGFSSHSVSLSEIKVCPHDATGDAMWSLSPDGSVYPMFLPQLYSFVSSDPSLLQIDAQGHITIVDTEADGSFCITVTCLADGSSVALPVYINGAESSCGNISAFDDDYAAALQTELVRLINEERVAAGLASLDYIHIAQDAADIRVEEFSEYPSHTRPDGTDFTTVIRDVALSGAFHAENGNTYLLGDGESPYEAAAGIVASWMNSSGHRGNILSELTESAVVGVLLDEDAYGRDCAYDIQLFSYLGTEKVN